MLDREKMRNEILKKGMKQKAVAKKSDMTERQLSMILTGKRKCDVDEYVRICRTLEVPISTFIVENHSSIPEKTA